MAITTTIKSHTRSEAVTGRAEAAARTVSTSREMATKDTTIDSHLSRNTSQRTTRRCKRAEAKSITIEMLIITKKIQRYNLQVSQQA